MSQLTLAKYKILLAIKSGLHCVPTLAIKLNRNRKTLYYHTSYLVENDYLFIQEVSQKPGSPRHYFFLTEKGMEEIKYPIIFKTEVEAY